jgi:hypothetical protein
MAKRKESTFERLQEGLALKRGFIVNLVDARGSKNLTGRTSDVQEV